MNRHMFYPGAIPLETDVLNIDKDAYYGDGWLAQAMVGVGTVVVGLAVTPTGPASLQVNVAPGAIFSLQTVDSVAYSSLGTDANQIVKVGIAPASSTLTVTPPGTVGQSINYLVQVQFSETDGSPVVLPYYNASNPTVAWSGPGNSGTPQNTVRTDSCVIQLKAGVAAATGSQVTPAPDAGYTGIYVITCAQGQTTITSGNIALLATAPYFPNLPQVPGAIQSSTWVYSLAGGTSNALTATLSPPLAAYGVGQSIIVKATTANTRSAVTINVNGLGTRAIVRRGGAALHRGDIQSGPLLLIDNGTSYELFGTGGGSRTPLSANLSLYVATTGSDSNDGLDPTAPFLTLQRAWSEVVNSYDLNGFVISIQVADGTYSAGIIATSAPLGGNSGTGSVIILATSGVAANVIINSTGNNCFAQGGAQFTLRNITLTASGANALCVVAGSGGIIAIDGVRFGASTQGHMDAVNGGFIQCVSNYSIVGGAQYHIVASAGGQVINASRTVTLTGTPAFGGAYAYCDQGRLDSSSTTYSGGATGVRYSVSNNGVIATAGAGASAFPGNAAGSATTGGQYV